MAAANQVRAGSAFVELTTRDSKLVRGLKSAQARLRAFGQSVTTLGSNLLRIGTVAAVPLALSVREFAGFEQAMARVNALTGASATEFEALTQEARKLGRTTTFTASQAAEAMQFFALAGFKVDEILRATNPTLSLAAAGQIEIAQAADIASKVMKSMEIGADELTHVVDVMAKAMTTANTDMVMLGDAFKFVGPIAQAGGVSLEEITAAIQLLSDAGIQGEMAGTTLRGMILSLTSPSAEASAQLRKLGVQINDASGNMRPLVEIIGDMEKAVNGFGSGKRLQILGTIFPQRQAAGASRLISQGADRLRTATDALRDSEGTGARIAAIQLNTLTGTAKILLSALQDVAIELGGALAPELREWVEGLIQAANVISKVIRENKELFATIGKTIVVVIAAGGALLALGAAIKLIAFAMGGLAAIFSLGIAVLGLIKVSILALFTPMGFMLKLLDSAVTAYLFMTEQGKATLSALGDAWNNVRDIATTAWSGIVDAVMAGDLALAGKIAMTALKAVWVEAINFLQIAWINFKDFLSATWNNAVAGLAVIMNDFATGLQVIWLEVTTYLSKQWAAFVGRAQKIWAKFIGFFLESWATAKGAVAAILGDDAGVQAAAQEIVRVQDDVANQVKIIDADTAVRRQDIEADRLRRGRQIVADQKAVEVALGEDLARLDLARGKERERQLDGLKGELNAAQEELRELVDQAAHKRLVAEFPPIGEALDHAAGRVPGLAAPGAADAGGLSGQTGTFSAEAARAMFGATSLQQRQVDLQEEAVRILKKIEQHEADAELLKFQ